MKVENVMPVNKLKANLLSVSQLCDNDTCIFHSKECEIRREDSGKLVGIVVRTPSNVYILENEVQCYVSQNNNGRFLF